MKTLKPIAATLAAMMVSVAFTGLAFAQTEAPKAARLPDVVFVPTPQPVVDAMLKLAKVQPDEMVYDLGCGDGRAVVTAARDFSARGIGVDIDPERIQESRANASNAGVTDRVEFKQEDLFQMKFTDADVVFLYLLPELNVRLRPRILDELRPGTRIVSHAFSMAEWEPDQHANVGGRDIMFWVVPAKVAGDWKVTLPGGEEGTLSLAQKFQKVDGVLKTKNKSLPLKDARLNGAKLTFDFGNGADAGTAAAEIAGQQLTGTVQRKSSNEPAPLRGELSQ
ncbi:MAG: SAM-dependent methyltransferase [Opitutaceae bacterium]